ncbi:MAG: hypothetical protein KAR39_11610 [Thermoplasmata archaeon]|nr:hypothetical protein [Thermoplasmata archaeon]
MTALTWDGTGVRFFETGIDKGVIYPMDGSGDYPLGVAWNGLISVSESPSGAEPSALYADNIKYLTLMSVEEFAATIEAFTYPPEFGLLDGSVAAIAGVLLGQQPRGKFGMVYRTRLGNDVAGDSLGYKLHLLYGLLAAPSEKGYQTVSDSPEAITFSWEVNSTPAAVSGEQPVSVITIDSTLATPTELALLELQLFGDVGDPNLPSPDEVITIMTP